MLEELREIDITALEKLSEIKKEQERLALFRGKADAMKSTVDDTVYRRVLADYASREAALEEKAEPLKASALEEYEKLSSIYERIEGTREQARATKVELEFRHAVGEFGKKQLEEKLAEPEGILEKCESQLEEADELKAQFEAALRAVNGPKDTLQGGHGADSKAEFDEQSKPENESRSAPDSLPEASPGVKYEAEPNAKSEVQPRAESEIKPEVGSEVVARAEPKPESELQARVISKSKSEAGSEVVSQAEPEPESGLQARVISKSKPEAGSEAVSQADPKPEPGLQARVISKSKPKAGSEAVSQAESKPEPGLQARVISKSKPRAGSEAVAQVESKVKPHTEVQPEVDSKRGTERWSEFEPQAPRPSPETQAQDSGPSTDKTFIRPSSDAIEESFAVPQAKLVILNEGRPTDEIRLGVMNYIGRSLENNIRIKSPAVSRKHALVAADVTNFTLKDLGSLSGTFVNTKKITECTLADGDRIKVGDVELVFRRL